MEEGVEVGETGALRGKCLEARVLDGTFIVNILEHDDQDAVEMVRLRTGGGAHGFRLLARFRLGDVGLRLRGFSRNALGDCWRSAGD